MQSTHVYKHYKGYYYRVLGKASHSETAETMVIYQQLYESSKPIGHLWVRPAWMFYAKISDVKPTGHKLTAAGPPRRRFKLCKRVPLSVQRIMAQLDKRNE